MENSKKTIGYQNGKIYKIISNQEDYMYIGSTIQQLDDRFGNHKRDYISYQKGKKRYITSYELLKHDNCQIILIENYPCNSRKELFAREMYHINQNNCINKVKSSSIIPKELPKIIINILNNQNIQNNKMIITIENH